MKKKTAIDKYVDSLVLATDAFVAWVKMINKESIFITGNKQMEVTNANK